MRIRKIEHGRENAAIEAVKRSCAEYLCNVRVNVRKYYEVPGELLDDPVMLVDWARESIRVARKLKKK